MRLKTMRSLDPSAGSLFFLFFNLLIPFYSHWSQSFSFTISPQLILSSQFSSLNDACCSSFASFLLSLTIRSSSAREWRYMRLLTYCGASALGWPRGGEKKGGEIWLGGRAWTCTSSRLISLLLLQQWDSVFSFLSDSGDFPFQYPTLAKEPEW